MTVETSDILLKAAEDVTQGMWCKGEWFSVAKRKVLLGFDSDEEAYAVLLSSLSVDEMAESERCAEGSLVFATRLLGGDAKDYATTVVAVNQSIGKQLYCYNDEDLPDDPFEAGQQLAELFRQTAESL